MTEEKMAAEAANYFRKEPGFDRLFARFKKKYESLGRIGGTVTIEDFSKEELTHIAAFFAFTERDLIKQRRISLAQFQNQLRNTRFAGLSLFKLLEAFYGETLYSHAQRQERKAAEQQNFFDELKKQYPHIRDWLVHVSKKSGDVQFIYKMYENDRSTLQKAIDLLAKAGRTLPEDGRVERLPLFAQRVAGDPHALDPGRFPGRLFLHYLAVLKAKHESSTPFFPVTSEERNDLLQHFGLLRDDLMNFVTCSGLLAMTERGLHPVWETAAREKTVWNVPVRELLHLKRIFPLEGKQVFIVENSGVCSAILDANPSSAIICTHGQFKLAAWMLLDRLCREEVTVYYSGDFDPEGLGMAEKLLRRYPKKVKLWHMGVEDYRRSRPEKTITAERLEKLKKIGDLRLRATVREMKKLKKAGYQEAILPELGFAEQLVQTIIFADRDVISIFKM